MPHPCGRIVSELSTGTAGGTAHQQEVLMCMHACLYACLYVLANAVLAWVSGGQQVLLVGRQSSKRCLCACMHACMLVCMPVYPCKCRSCMGVWWATGAAGGELERQVEARAMLREADTNEDGKIRCVGGKGHVLPVAASIKQPQIDRSLLHALLLC
eukprot:1150342-Pelagomonas_calceolata.AAC.21